MDTVNNPLETPIQFVKGVGPKRAKLFEQLNILTVNDLLLHLPMRYEDRSEKTPIRHLKAGSHCVVVGDILATSWHKPKFGKGFFEVVVGDGSGHLSCRWFGGEYLKDILRNGMKITACAKPTKLKGKWLMMHPEYELEGSHKERSIYLGRIVPVYPLTDQLPQRTLQRIVWQALELYLKQVVDLLPAVLRERLHLLPIEEALRAAHFPESMWRAGQGRRRLVFEEFLLFQLLIARRKSLAGNRVGQSFRVEGSLKKAFAESLPFNFTQAQRRVLLDIQRDMFSEVPMNRLLQGDVGSGKTVVAICASLDAIEAGAQVAVMAPTEVLANQHFLLFSRYLTSVGLECALVTGDLSAAHRRNALAGLKSGRIRLVVGTHAIVYDQVVFDRLGLVIIDEQHKFGVEQRAALHKKGVYPDVLVMTATPIPRTLAMTIYGDLDVSIIDELPAGRQEIVTRVIDEETLPAAYDFVKQQVAKGRQSYFVYPLVDESETLELDAAKTMFEKLKGSVFTKERLALLHGRLPSAEKQKIMSLFKEGEIDILVSTTVIEVGIDVPNANIMLVGNAERFGLAQLHQLRGRVGRGKVKAFCILQGVAKSLDSWRRLKIMEETGDGFRIAEEDLKIRGMGNILGKEQSGFPILKVGNPVADVDILNEARREAFRIVQEDPERKNEVYKPLWRNAEVLAEKVGTLAQVG